MSDAVPFDLAVFLVGVVGIAAVLSNRVTAWLRVPAPALVFAAAALAIKIVPDLHPPAEATVERLVTIALVCILFDGGLHIGRARFRQAGAPIAIVGLAGTFGTVAASAVALHAMLGLAWYPALLVGTAVAPTDPAVVFSVLGRREVSGLGGTVLEGESGANDPVGIALMASLISAGSVTGGAIGHVLGEFVLQLAVGLAIGVVGGIGLLWFTSHVPLPSEGLYPVRTLASALALFGAAALAHGSGFLAVFVAGIVLGDARAPYKREIERFHGALASLGEIVAFTVLGLTVDLGELAKVEVWAPGLGIGALLAVVIRPLAVGPCLVGSRLKRGERAFVLFAGLKGAVPILLGTLLLGAGLADSKRLYGIVVVVVMFSVIVQGSLMPAAARLLHVPMRTIEPEPWSLGVRLRDEPNGVHRLTVAVGSAADGHTIAELAELPEGAWISFIVRDGRLVPVTGKTALRAGDEALVLGDPQLEADLSAIFETDSS